MDCSFTQVRIRWWVNHEQIIGIFQKYSDSSCQTSMMNWSLMVSFDKESLENSIWCTDKRLSANLRTVMASVWLGCGQALRIDCKGFAKQIEYNMGRTKRLFPQMFCCFLVESAQMPRQCSTIHQLHFGVAERHSTELPLRNWHQNHLELITVELFPSEDQRCWRHLPPDVPLACSPEDGSPYFDKDSLALITVWSISRVEVIIGCMMTSVLEPAPCVFTRRKLLVTLEMRWDTKMIPKVMSCMPSGFPSLCTALPARSLLRKSVLQGQT